ncbi:eCIS core domain-containing protein, partial [Streptomyces boluensis]
MTIEPAQAQSAHDDRSKRRKQRKARREQVPEPKNIVSGAGQPLDLSVRRDLEEQLGHDLGNIRLHTDRDANALTDMLGADAVAVGQEIFFREGAYQPGTSEGQALLAHELLHTIQNPYGHGPLAAGRELGAVSLPHEAAEQEAESAAQALTRGEQVEEVGPEPQTPAWMRYATVDADRTRLERADPASLIDRLANTILRTLRADPEDRSKRTRIQLMRLPEELEDAVLDRLEDRLLSSEHERLLDLFDAAERDDDLGPGSPLLAPDLAPDAAEELNRERETEQRKATEEEQDKARPATAAGPEKEQASTSSGSAEGSTPQNDTSGSPQGGNSGKKSGKESGRPDGSKEPGPQTGGDASRPRGDGEQPEGPAAQSEKKDEQQADGGGKGEKGAAEGKDGQAQQEQGEKERQQKDQLEKKDGGDRAEGKKADEKGREDAAQKEAAGREAEGEQKDAEKQREKNAETAESKEQQKEQEGKGEKEGALEGAKRDEEFPGRSSSLDGARSQDLLGEEEPEKTPDKGGDSEVEVGGGEKSAWDEKLRPE